MTFADWFRVPNRNNFRPGDAVRINRGPLRHLTGVVVKLAPDGRCVVALDCDPQSVLIVLGEAALEKADPLSHRGKSG